MWAPAFRGAWEAWRIIAALGDASAGMSTARECPDHFWNDVGRLYPPALMLSPCRWKLQVKFCFFPLATSNLDFISTPGLPPQFRTLKI